MLEYIGILIPFVALSIPIVAITLSYKQKTQKNRIREMDKSYKGCLQGIGELVKRMFVRGSGIRDISFILCISIKKVLKIPTTSIYHLTPKHYDALEIDEFWTYVGNKKNKLWLTPITALPGRLSPLCGGNGT